VNLAGLTLMLLLPMILMCWDYRRVETWSHPALAPLVALSLICTLYMFDHLMNGMVNPIFMLACGGATMAHAAVPRLATAQQPRGGFPVRPMGAPRPVPAYAMRTPQPMRRAG
jgi:hypothetical protein